jgi:hypothetical protein
MDEPRTHLVLRELVQLVHLPLVVVPHGPGRARARTASRGAGPSERCRTSNSSGCFLFTTPSVYVMLEFRVLYDYILIHGVRDLSL